jgi:hypothetical protein
MKTVQQAAGHEQKGTKVKNDDCGTRPAAISPLLRSS